MTDLNSDLGDFTGSINSSNWVFATGNAGKAKEIEALLKPVGISILTLRDIGFNEDIEETGSTFKENALIKAEAVAKASHLPLLADDSGLSVEALNGAPGVYSARYAGIDATDEDNRNKLLASLKGVQNRKAHFTCLLCLLLPGAAKPQYFEGICRGRIAEKEFGSGGFGYDPLFVPDGYQKTFGELEAKVKHSLSHRGLAVQKLLDCLKA